MWLEYLITLYFIFFLWLCDSNRDKIYLLSFFENLYAYNNNYFLSTFLRKIKSQLSSYSMPTRFRLARFSSDPYVCKFPDNSRSRSRLGLWFPRKLKYFGRSRCNVLEIPPRGALYTRARPLTGWTYNQHTSLPWVFFKGRHRRVDSLSIDKPHRWWRGRQADVL